MQYPYIFLDTDPESNTEGLYSICWSESFSEDGLTLEEAQLKIEIGE